MLSLTTLLCQRPGLAIRYFTGWLVGFCHLCRSLQPDWTNGNGDHLKGSPFDFRAFGSRFYQRRRGPCLSHRRDRAPYASLGCGGSGNSVLMALEVSARRFCWNSLTQLLTVETISRAASCGLFLVVVSLEPLFSWRLLSLRLMIFIGAFFVMMTCTSSLNDCLLLG
jgi:hypothetical protein